jgi:hypothetical protein
MKHVERFFAFATVSDHFTGAELGELGGNARLGHIENFAQFTDGELFDPQ